MDRSWRAALLAFSILLACVFMAPIAVVAILSFGEGSYLKFPPSGFSLQWYARLIEDERWLASFYRSVQIGVLASALATVTGFFLAYSLARGTYSGKRLILSLTLLPMIVPGVITAIGLYYVSSQLRLTGNIVWIATCHAVTTLPIVVMILLGGLKTIDFNLERAAFSMGAGRLMTFRYILLPLLFPALLSSTLFSFLGSFDELVISMFLSGTTTVTLPVRIWNSLTLQVEPTIAAVSTFLVAITVLLLLIDGASKRRRRA
ncbi:MAG: binding-protein-dependent transport system inner rane component [Rubritepida sp.]|nr:binding-protein-dependent transport system inner rane component [Rubritepida sp.]